MFCEGCSEVGDGSSEKPMRTWLYRAASSSSPGGDGCGKEVTLDMDTVGRSPADDCVRSPRHLHSILLLFGNYSHSCRVSAGNFTSTLSAIYVPQLSPLIIFRDGPPPSLFQIPRTLHVCDCTVAENQLSLLQNPELSAYSAVSRSSLDHDVALDDPTLFRLKSHLRFVFVSEPDCLLWPENVTHCMQLRVSDFMQCECVSVSMI